MPGRGNRNGVLRVYLHVPRFEEGVMSGHVLVRLGWPRRVAVLGLLLAVPTSGWAGGVAAWAAAAGTDPAFGTGPMVGAARPGGQVTVTAVDVARHAGFDRVVFRLSGLSLGYDVRYAPRLVEDPTGRVLPLAGSAVLTVALRGTRWTQTPSPQLNRTPGFPALRQVRSAGEFEAVASYGLGQAGRDGFRVFRLTGPDRLVVDLRHPAGAAGAAGTPSSGAVPGGSGSAGSGSAGAGSTGAGSAGSGSAPTEGVGAVGTADPASGSTRPVGSTGPVSDGDSPLPAIVVGVLVVGLLAAGLIAVRAR
ncbi:MAG: hypothetical protein ACJ73E_18200 [Mycobacteriales bacterium]